MRDNLCGPSVSSVQRFHCVYKHVKKTVVAKAVTFRIFSLPLPFPSTSAPSHSQLLFSSLLEAVTEFVDSLTSLPISHHTSLIRYSVLQDPDAVDWYQSQPYFEVSIAHITLYHSSPVHLSCQVYHSPSL